MSVSAPGEEAGETVGTTTKDLEYYVNLACAAAAGFERVGSRFERSSVPGKLLASTTWCRQIVHERLSQSLWQTSSLS